MARAAESPPVQQLVVIGSSAGGIEALSQLLKAMPPDLPAPIVIAQHIAPTTESHLEEILQRQTSLRVKTVKGREPLEPGVVFVVPANRHVQVTDHHVSLSKDSTNRPRPSINLLLTTAAQAFGERLIAIILSGTGSDGAIGAEAVKRAGGTVIIQNPETARYPGMPRSLAPAVVDMVAELEEMGSIIFKLLADGRQRPVAPEAQRELRGLLEELRILRGVDFNSYKLPTIERRLQRRMIATKTDGLGAYRQYVRDHPEEQDELVRAFLIKVTEFFRDDELFGYLRERLLPQLLLEARKRDNQLRLWSAGCATGQEAYSLAILVAELLGAELERFGVRIFATDLDPKALSFARRGVYPRTAVEHLPPELVERYFTHVDGECEVSRRIRSLIIFGDHDLAQRAPFPAIDLILCRNVLMYFDSELQKRALHLFAFSLRDAGYLILGKAETLSPLPEFFLPDHHRLRIYRRHGDRTLIPATRAGVSPGARPAQTAAAAAGLAQSRATSPAARERSPASSTLDVLPMGVVIVDRHYDIRAINPAARRLLDIHVPGEDQDFIHLLRVVDASLVRGAIDSAFRTSQPAKLRDLPVTDPTSDSPRHLEIVCYPGQSSDDDTPASVTVTVTVVSPDPAAERTPDVLPRVAQDEAADVRQRLQMMAQQLVEVREANEELLQTNRQLGLSRDELISDTAAVQAASEEVETLNEELHATNEELETLNEEMQATLEELQATNDDLAAQTAELGRLTVEHETQRRRFEAMVNSIGDAVLVVDSHGGIVLANPAYKTLFGSASALFTAELPDGTPVKATGSPQQRAARGEEFTMEFMALAMDGTRRWLEATGRPVEADGETHSILVIRDITDRSLRQLQERFLAMASHELRTPLTSLFGNAQLLSRALERGSPSSEELRAPVAIVLQQARRLQRLIEDLLDAERLRGKHMSLDLEEVDLRELVRTAIELERPLAGTRDIRLDVPDKPVIVQCDSGRLEQVVINLVNNALAHAPQSEHIDVRLRVAEERAEIEVQDYGPGIPAAEQAQLFTPFYQVNRGQESHEGLGLGLFISHELVAAHGGTLDVSSSEGQGATFRVRLPLCRRS